MLDGLNEIDWGSLTHAYGPATDVPDLLRGLADPDHEQDALSELFGNIWHQGTVYEASAYAVPFLAELAADPRVRQRDLIVGLIALIADGSSYLEVHANPDSRAGQRLRSELDFADRLNRELVHVQHARTAVRRHLRLFEQLLSDPDPKVRIAAAHALARFHEAATEVEPPLVAAFERETSPPARAGMLWSLGALRRVTSPTAGLLNRTIEAADDDRIAFAAAVALHRLNGHPPARTRALYARMAATPWFTESFLGDVPWNYSNEVDFDELLSGVDPDPQGATDMLLKVLADPDWSCDLFTPVVHDLLAINFPEKDWRRSLPNLSERQREILCALVATDAPWHDSKRLWFLLPDGAHRISSITPGQIQAVRDEMRRAAR